MKVYVVMTKGNGGKIIPIAWSYSKQKAVWFSNESVRGCKVKSMDDIALLHYIDQYYLTRIS